MSEDYDNPFLRQAEEDVARQGGRQSGADAADSVRNASAVKTIQYLYQDLKNTVAENIRPLILAGVCAATLTGLFYAADKFNDTRLMASCKTRANQELTVLEKTARFMDNTRTD